MNGKIMDGDDLESIMNRLICCGSLLATLQQAIDNDKMTGEALDGVCDLLECICRDFQADIDGAKDYTVDNAERVAWAS